MSRFLSLLVVALAVGFTPVHAQSSASDRVIGTWTGTYAGDGSGKYTMVLSREAADKIGGTVEAVSDDGNTFKATFKSVVVEGTTVKMAYDNPGNDATEVQLEATMDSGSMTGTWKSVDTSAKSVVASGTFTGSKR